MILIGVGSAIAGAAIVFLVFWRIRRQRRIQVVWGDGLNAEDIERLREQIDFAQSDPNFIIITNYPVSCAKIPINQTSRSRRFRPIFRSRSDQTFINDIIHRTAHDQATLNPMAGPDSTATTNPIEPIEDVMIPSSNGGYTYSGFRRNVLESTESLGGIVEESGQRLAQARSMLGEKYPSTDEIPGKSRFQILLEGSSPETPSKPNVSK